MGLGDEGQLASGTLILTAHYAHLAPSHVAQLIRDNLRHLGGPAPPRKSRKVTRLRT